METAHLHDRAVTVDEYLEGEQQTAQKHEYLAGQIVAMGGASRRHGLLASQLVALLKPAARAKGCQLFVADMNVRIDHEGESWFYYPDLVLACSPEDSDPLCVRSPRLLVEIISPSSETIDTREKLLAYRLLPSLHEYLLLRQDHLQADLYTRRPTAQPGMPAGWSHTRYTAPTDLLRLDCPGVAVTLADVYADLPDVLTTGAAG